MHLDSGCVLKQVPPPRVEKQKAVRHPLPVHSREGVVGMALRNPQTACSSLSLPAAYSHLTITNSAGPECIRSSLLSRQKGIETLEKRVGWRWLEVSWALTASFPATNAPDRAVHPISSARGIAMRLPEVRAAAMTADSGVGTLGVATVSAVHTRPE